MTSFIDLTNRSFGLLKALHRTKNKNNYAMWVCVCECGNNHTVRSSHLLSGAIKSCGCLRERERTTHGRSNSSEYVIWVAMKARCNNKNATSYHRYGGRGISVCDSWLGSFEKFYADMGPRPSKDYSIDRIDNDGNYEPTNCHWATTMEQSRNCRIRITNKSGVTGVLWRIKKKRWVSRIHINGENKLLYYGTSFPKAVEARKQAEKLYW